MNEYIEFLPVTKWPLNFEEAIFCRGVLKAAADRDGRIMHLRYMGGEEIQAGGQSMIPEENSRTIARWVGGLEDLQRRRYIKALGHKGEAFEITREGYEAADELTGA